MTATETFYGTIASATVPVTATLSGYYNSLLVENLGNPEASPASLSATGSLAITASGQIIASAALPAGTYTVNWSVIITGTVSGADDNNVQIMVGSTVIAVSVNADNGNQIYPQAPVVIVIPAGGATVSIQSVTGGSGTATYKSGFTATPVASGNDQIIWVRADGTAAVSQGDGCFAVYPGQSLVVDNGLPSWSQGLANVPAGTMAATKLGAPATVVPMGSSVAGGIANPGSKVSVIGDSTVSTNFVVSSVD